MMKMDTVFIYTSGTRSMVDCYLRDPSIICEVSEKCMETTVEQDKEIAELVKKTNLKHIAIIMDGNRRWAKQKGLPSAIGHKKGVDALKKTVYACDDNGMVCDTHNKDR